MRADIQRNTKSQIKPFWHISVNSVGQALAVHGATLSATMMDDDEHFQLQSDIIQHLWGADIKTTMP
jgi:hypothetical protein